MSDDLKNGTGNVMPTYGPGVNITTPPATMPERGPVEPQNVPMYPPPAPTYAVDGNALPDHAPPAYAPPPAPQYTNPAPDQASATNYHARANSPSPMTTAQYAGVTNSGHSTTSALSNAGALGGMAVGMAGGGGGMAGDMITGMVVGNIVGQRVHQHQVREQARINAANGILPDPNTRAGRRAERRSKRHERRSKRNEKIKNLFGVDSSSSDSDGDKDGRK